MKVLKGIKRVDKILNKFLEPYEITVQLSDEFAYAPAKNIIRYTFIVMDEQEEAFQDFLKEKAPDIHCDAFLLSFLHELGHHEVGEEFLEQYPFTYVNKEYARLSQEAFFAKSMEERYQLNMEYFNLPWEWGATEWAINYMRNNKAEVAALWKKLSKAIQRVYKLNHIS